MKDVKDYENIKSNNSTSQQNYHFIGSSFGKNSVPPLHEIVKVRQLLQRKEPTFYENKISEEVKLNDSTEESQEPFSSSKPIVKIETEKSQNSLNTQKSFQSKN